MYGKRIGGFAKQFQLLWGYTGSLDTLFVSGFDGHREKPGHKKRVQATVSFIESLL